MGREGTGAQDVDARLLGAARSGDSAAFVDLLRRHDRLLRLVAWQVLGDRDLMDDALQEVAMKAWRSLDTFRSEAAVSTWLARITYHAAVDLLRLQRGEQPVVAGDAANVLWADHDSAGDPASRLGERDMLRAAFAGLSADQRVTVMLVDHEGCDYDTVARVLGVRPGTVASRLHRARAALRAALSVATQGDGR